MTRRDKKLTSLAINKQNRPGMYGDGAGLWLQVMASGVKSWIFRYMKDGKAREMGLGPIRDVSLPEARDRAGACRKLLLDGKDPIDERKALRQTEAYERAKAITFAECTAAYIEAHKSAWTNAKHESQWRNSLRDYALPHLGTLSVSAVDTGLVLKCLEPIWLIKAETATRVRERIERILDWAKARGYRQGDNPAVWKGHLDKLLPRRSKNVAVRHHPALPYAEIGEFIKALRAQPGIAASALEFTILTAARTGETIFARWVDVDLEKSLWIVPKEKMKTKREHRVPLSKAAVAILQRMASLRLNDYVFPGARQDKPLSNMAMLKVLERMGREDLTVHGFRSTFRDWTAELTAYPREVAEMALAHTIGNDVEEAYRRGDLLMKRYKLMADWATYCDSVPIKTAKNIVPIRKGRSASAATKS
ncbi:MAG: tyrosine-type recombinase/integrase [Burkholderiaceae bacterium]|nr:tyrosine-type recombinase/integrase [Sulfuritalea sp.]MCF8175209.1 tyrosine-type recombinase/integrase [Burkholderiaceae bacterium]